MPAVLAPDVIKVPTCCVCRLCSRFQIEEGGLESAVVERYKPGLNIWESLPSMKEARGQCRGCVTADGCFVVSGGINRFVRGRSPPILSVALRLRASWLVTVWHHPSQAQPLRSVEVFTPAMTGGAPHFTFTTGVWSSLPDMRVARIHHSTCTHSSLQISSGLY